MLAKILLLITLIVAATAQFSFLRIPYVEILETCAKKNGFRMGLNESEVETMEGCILSCAMKRVGTLGEDGYWNAGSATALIPRIYPKYHATVAALRHCATKIGKTDCETPNVVRQCLLKELPCRYDYTCAISSYLFLLYTPEALKASRTT